MSGVVGLVAPPLVDLTGHEGLDVLAADLARACAMPIDRLQVAALLETAGVTDSIARNRYGTCDVFALADVLLSRLARPTTFGGMSPPEPGVAARHQLARDLSRGPLAVMPMILLSFIIAVYQGIGHWPPGHIIALSFAMVGSLLVTSGFVQAASRKGASYLCQGYVSASARVVAWIVGAGLVAVCICTALLAWRAPSVMASDAAAILVVAFFVLSLLWLGAGVLFMLGSVLAFAVALVAGVGLSYSVVLGLAPVLVERSTVIVAAAAAGTVCTLIVLLLAIRRAYRQHAAHVEAPRDPVLLPPLPHLLVSLAPYFVYGIAYVALILLGHLVCWQSKLPVGVTRSEAVTATEAGLTFALIGYILAGGVAEHTIGRFWRSIRTLQWQASPNHPGEFGSAVRSFFLHEQARFATALTLSSALVTVLLAAALRGRLLPWSSQTSIVYALGLCGYGLIGLGVFDCMFMVTLSRPALATRVLGLGSLATGLLGWVLGQRLGLAWAGFAIVAGGLLVLITAHWQLHRMLERMDYWYYASF